MKTNVLYTQVDNPFTLIANIPLADIECSINQNGSIVKQNNDWFTIRVTEPGTYDVSLKQQSTGKQITYSFRAKRLPTPFASIMNVLNDSITTSQLLTAEKLSLSYIPAFDFYIQSEIIEFSVLKISKDNVRLELNNKSGFFSDDLKALIKNCNKDDILIFRKIVAKGPDPGSLRIPDMIIYIR